MLDIQTSPVRKKKISWIYVRSFDWVGALEATKVVTGCIKHVRQMAIVRHLALTGMREDKNPRTLSRLVSENPENGEDV